MGGRIRLADDDAFDSAGAPSRWRDAVRAGNASLEQAARAADGCRACELWRDATQTVFGAGPVGRQVLMMIGEQPGDREDRSGQPFVGPAGGLLDRALQSAGIDRRAVYVTNTVKHFHWQQRGKWRIHKKPRPHQVRACRPWLEAEIAAVAPALVVCLGATAAQALLGSSFRVTAQRGELLSSPLASRVLATVHPSSILRADDDSRDRAMRDFVADLKVARQVLHGA